MLISLLLFSVWHKNIGGKLFVNFLVTRSMLCYYFLHNLWLFVTCFFFIPDFSLFLFHACLLCLTRNVVSFWWAGILFYFVHVWLLMGFFCGVVHSVKKHQWGKFVIFCSIFCMIISWWLIFSKPDLSTVVQCFA